MKTPSYKQRRKAENIAFSPEFKERIKEIRFTLGIPEGGFPKDTRIIEGLQDRRFPKEGLFYPVKAKEWYTNHLKKAERRQPKKLPQSLPRYYWYFPREIAELIEGFTYSNHPCRPGFHAKAPLDIYAMDLVQKFGLPEDIVDEVKHQILVEESSGFGTSSMLQTISIPMEGQDGPYFCEFIAGIDGSTTKKDWMDIWQKIKLQMKEKGITMGPTKRNKDSISLRDLAWWKWSKEGLTAREIADNWETKTNMSCGEDTVHATVKRIDEEMRAIS